MNQTTTAAHEGAHEYHVEMTFVPFATPPAPEQVASFAERFVFPTLDACQKLRESGRIVAGGTVLAAPAFSFIARAKSPSELEAMLVSLPLWPRAQTRVVPLGSFKNRMTAARQRLQTASMRDTSKQEAAS